MLKTKSVNFCLIPSYEEIKVVVWQNNPQISNSRYSNFQPYISKIISPKWKTNWDKLHDINPCLDKSLFSVLLYRHDQIVLLLHRIRQSKVTQSYLLTGNDGMNIFCEIFPS
jgi:hypothetical protein